MFLHVLAQRADELRIFRELLHQNLPRALQGRLRISHTGIVVAILGCKSGFDVG